MAEASISVDQDQFCCSVCLDLLKDPVTIPCGHSYCKVCINGCWDQEDQKGVYSCPQCRKTFTPRPDLHRNNMLAGVVEKLKKTKLQAASPAHCYAGPGDVECDSCTGRKHKAIKSCLVCLASYCEPHLQPHYQSPAFKKHKLVEASKQLQEKICFQHDKLIEIYCRTDQQFICYLCTMDEHKGHDTVAAVAERKEKQTELKEMQRKTQQRIQEKEKKLQEVKQAVEDLKCSAQTAVEDSEKIFTELICSIEKKLTEVTKLIRDQEKIQLSGAEELLEQLEQEISDLKRRDTELEQLSHTEDHIQFLQALSSRRSPTFPRPTFHSWDSTSTTVLQHLLFDGVRKSLSDLKERLEEFCKKEFSEIPPQDFLSTGEDVVQAVRESHDCSLIRSVLAKECQVCFSVFPNSKMQSLPSCQCSVCSACFKLHFTIVVRDKHIRDMVCPVCSEPDINDPEHSYFSTLDVQLRDCLEPDVYELFHKKLTEQALIKDPTFLWCNHCLYGFIYDGDQLKVTCLQCRNSFCAQCKKPWEAQHTGLSCEQYQLWKRMNDPEYQRQGLAGYLRDNGITCPNCRFQYALARGGRMHFSCSQCRYQFCSGCNNPFHTTCAVVQCSVTGLHAHHPRDCLFYLRDWEPARLQALLQKNAVAFNTDTAPRTQTGVCGVIEQKDLGGRQRECGDRALACGAQTQPGQAGLCEKHYREYLVSLINGHSLDPAPLFSPQELTLACKRYQVELVRGEGENERTYRVRQMKKLMEDVPLGDKVPRKK